MGSCSQNTKTLRRMQASDDPENQEAIETLAGHFAIIERSRMTSSFRYVGPAFECQTRSGSASLNNAEPAIKGQSVLRSLRLLPSQTFQRVVLICTSTGSSGVDIIGIQHWAERPRVRLDVVCVFPQRMSRPIDAHNRRRQLGSCDKR